MAAHDNLGQKLRCGYRREYSPEAHSWMPSPDSNDQYHIRIPSGAEPEGAVLIYTVGPSKILARAYMKPEEGLEIEYRMLNSITPANYKGRVLQNVSSGQIRKLTNCEWSSPCDLTQERVDLNRFLLGRHDDAFPRWERMYKQTDPVDRELVKDEAVDRIWHGTKYKPVPAYSWSSYGRQKFFIIRPRPRSFFSALLIETTEGKLTGAFRMRSNRTEQEFRPLLGNAELPLDQYLSVETWRRKRSSHHDDLAEVRYEFPETGSLHKAYGVSWGSSWSDVQTSQLLRGYKAVEPRHLFKPLAELQSSDWYLPDWTSVRASNAETSIFTTDDEQVFFYRRSDSRFLRLLLFAESGGQNLQRIYEYSADGKLKVISPPEQQAVEVRSRKLPSSLGLRIKHMWGSSFEDLSSLRIDERPDPGDFFRVRGQAFLAWKGKFDAARAQHAPVGDGSWSDAEGHRYAIFADRHWPDIVGQKPAWYILEYRENQLGAIHHFDRTWTPRVYVPFRPPPFNEAFFERTGKSLEEARRWVKSAEREEIADLRNELTILLTDYETQPPPEGKALSTYLKFEIAMADDERTPLPETSVLALFELPHPLRLSSGAVGVLLLVLSLMMLMRRRRTLEFDIEGARRRQQSSGAGKRESE